MVQNMHFKFLSLDMSAPDDGGPINYLISGNLVREWCCSCKPSFHFLEHPFIARFTRFVLFSSFLVEISSLA